MNEKIEKLGRFSVICSDIHKFGTDAVLLCDFANVNSARNMCEFGCGCGIITTLACQKNENLKVTAVDIQEDAAALTSQSCEMNNITDRVNVLCEDLKMLDKTHNGKFDLVVMNPPYKKFYAGIKSGNKQVDIARFEVMCDINDICSTASRLLKYHGRLCICHRPERLAELMALMSKYKLEPKRLRLVCQRRGEEPWLVLVEGKKCANVGLRIEPTLYVEENGEFSDEMIEIYGSYKEAYL